MPSATIRVLCIALASLPLLLSLLLLFVCTTIEGTAFGWGGVCLSPAPMLACFARERKSGRLWLMAAGAVVSWMTITSWLAVKAPDGHAVASSKVHFAKQRFLQYRGWPRTYF